MKRSVTITQKIGYYAHKVGLRVLDTVAQGGIIGFFIGAMIAVVIALQVTWPVMDSVISGTSMANMSTAAQTLVDQLPLFLVLVLLMIFVKAVI